MALPTRVSRNRGMDPFDLMRRDFSDLMTRFFGQQGLEESGGLAPFGVDIREDADHIFVEADMPGFRKEDIDVSMDGGVLTIRAEKREEPAPEGQPPDDQQRRPDQGYLLRERSYRRFERSFTLPPNVDEQNIQAKLDNGCLVITLNKAEQTKPRRIDVQ